MGRAAYLWERFCFLTYAPFLMYTAMFKPSYFWHLTYWTLTLHAVYFTIDKASPYAKAAIYLLHGMSFGGAIGVFVGYSFISLGGMYRFGTWTEWENAVGARAGTVTHDRSFEEVAVQKFYEHLWPVFASLIDASLSRDELQAAFAGAPKFRTTLLAVGSYLVYGSIWELAAKGQGKGSPLDVYVQPQEFATSYIFGKMGLDATGLPEDLIFTNAQKLALVTSAFYVYWKWVTPCFELPATKKKTKAK